MPNILYRIRHSRFMVFIDRGRNGFAPSDCWGLDSYLSEVLVKALDQLRTTTHSYPVEMKSPEEWDAVLSKMIEGFEVHLELRERSVLGEVDGKFDSETYKRECAKQQKKLDRALTLFKKYYGDLWD